MNSIPITLLILGVAIVLFLSDRFRPDLIALLVLISLGLTGILTAQESFSGFSRSAVITIMAIFILSEGLRVTGITEKIGEVLIRLAGSSEIRLIIVTMLSGAFFSLFMNNIAAAAILLPAIVDAGRKANISPSRSLMPLAFGTILGGMATLLTTTNIVVSSILRDSASAGYGLLDFAPIGLPIIMIGVAYMVVWGRRMLPAQPPIPILEDQKTTAWELLKIYRLGERLFKAQVMEDSYLVGKKLSNSRLRDELGLNVVGIQRNHKTIFSIDPDIEFRPNDVLIITSKDYAQAFEQARLKVLPLDNMTLANLEAPNIHIIEAVLAPRSSLIGATLRQIHFRDKYGLNVLAIWRAGHPIRTGLQDLTLQFGDALLLQGSQHTLPALRTEPDLLIIPGLLPKPLFGKAWLAGSIMVITLILAASGIFQIGEIMLGGALAMILLGILSMDQVYKAIEWKSIFLIAGMLPLGIAMTKTGTAALLGDILVHRLAAAGPTALLAGLIALAILLTQAINGPAVASILAPIAIQAAHAINADPRAMAMGVALGTSMAFITPLGHPVNILVMGLGGYRFRDYVKVGLPLTVILFVLVIYLLPIFWPLSQH